MIGTPPDEIGTNGAREEPGSMPNWGANMDNTIVEDGGGGGGGSCCWGGGAGCT